MTELYWKVEVILSYRTLARWARHIREAIEQEVREVQLKENSGINCDFGRKEEKDGIDFKTRFLLCSPVALGMGQEQIK